MLQEQIVEDGVEEVDGAEKPKSLNDRLAEIFYEACEATNWNREEAAVRAGAVLRAEPEVFKKFQEQVVNRAIRDRIASTATHVNRGIEARADGIRASNNPFPKTGGLRALAEERLDELLNTTLSGGGQLKDATKRDVLDQAAIHDLHETSNRIKRRWFEMIAEPMKEYELVGRKFSNEQLEELRQKARKGE